MVAMKTTTISRDSRTPIAAHFSATTAFLLSSVVTLAYHVRAEASESLPPTSTFLERLQAGPRSFTTMDFVLIGAVLLAPAEGMDFACKRFGDLIGAKSIPVRGKHLDTLSASDFACIFFSKLNTAPFTYFYFKFAYDQPNCPWQLSELNFLNTAVALTVLVIVFDFFYVLFHWFLHVKAVYGWIHKHHHQQKAPSRAYLDAMNVHPIEMVVGTYCHLFTMWLVTSVMGLPVHVMTALIFVSVGGFMAGLNHTRQDVRVELWNVVLFDTKDHDVHHRVPQSNYGQYTMFWDVVFGTYRPYDPQDRINPEAQLDPATGKSLQYNNNKKAN